MIDLLSNTYFIGLIAILINGIVTGFAVYIGSHTGARMIDRIKEKRVDIKQEADLEAIKKMVVGVKHSV